MFHYFAGNGEIKFLVAKRKGIDIRDLKFMRRVLLASDLNFVFANVRTNIPVAS